MSKPTFANVLFWCVAAAGAVALNVLVLAVAGVLPGASSAGAPAPSTEAAEAPVAEAVKPLPTPGSSPASVGTTTPPELKPAQPKPAPRTVVVVSAARGDSWFSARLGSESGRVLDERILAQGESARFQGRRIWLTVGAAGNVDLTVNGKPRELAPGTISLVLARNS